MAAIWNKTIFVSRAPTNQLPVFYRRVCCRINILGSQLSPSCINLVPAQAGKAIVGLAWHWPYITDTVVYPPTGSTAKDREMSKHAYAPSGRGTIYLTWNSLMAWPDGPWPPLSIGTRTTSTWALLRWWFTTKRRYIKCMYLYLYFYAFKARSSRYTCIFGYRKGSR